ncbi:MAG: S8 family serine peptidase [Verrucomicrobiota bacterium]
MKILHALGILLLAQSGIATLQAGGPVSPTAPTSIAQSGPSQADLIELPGGLASPDALLVKTKLPQLTDAAVRSAVANQQLRISKRFRSVPGLYGVSLDGTNTKSKFDKELLQLKIKQLKATGQFEYVEPNWQVTVQQVPSDSSFTNGDLWGLQNTGQSGGVSGVDVNAVNAWATTTGSSSVVVGVVDSGIRYTHQDLSANMWTNPGEIPGNGQDDDNNGYVDDVFGINAINGSGDPMDDNDHGTHVAGTIAATANNGSRHVGVAYNVRVMGLKFLGANGSGNTSDAIECIEYAINEGVDILNNSWGGGGFSQALLDVIEAANNAGILFLAAAGNSSSDNDAVDSYPSNYEVENVIAVAAIDRAGNLASFSSFGARTVDLGAPGVSILSCTAQSDSSYSFFNGTSMATPHVAGVAALLMSEYPTASVSELRNRLLNTTVPLNSLAGRTVTGGMVDASAGLNLTADGNLEVSVQPRETLLAGESVIIDIRISDLQSVTNATVTARFGSSGGFTTFFDNGLGDDQDAGDGVYSASLQVPISGSTVNLNGNISAPGKNSAVLSVSFDVTAPPANDDFSSRIGLTAGTTQTTGSNVNATFENTEPRSPSVAGGKTVWWDWVAPSSGTVTISTTGSNYDTTLAIYSGNALNGLSLEGSNDDSFGLQSAVTFTAQSGTSYKVQVDGYAGATGDIQLNYPSPSGVGLPVIITQPVGRSVLIDTAFTLSVSANGSGLSYQWYLDGVSINGATSSLYSVSSAQESDEGNYTVEITNSVGTVVSNQAFVAVEQVLLTPPNDDLANAEVLVGVTGQVQGTNELASGESGEPNHAGVSDPLASVWWEWTAPANGILFLNTFGSDYDTTMAVYTGSTPGSLSFVSSNDDAGGVSQSSVSTQVSAGVTYRIAVDGFENSVGQISLEYTFVDSDGIPNDLFSDRIFLPSASTYAFGLNVGASGESGEPIHAGTSTPLASVWWSWTAPADGSLIVATSGSTFDTTLAVYQGTVVNSLSLVASNDDAFDDLTSGVTIQVTQGQSYEIAVDGYDNAEGIILLNLILTPDNNASSGNVFLLEDRAGFGETTQVLFDQGYNVTVFNDDALFNNFTAQDPDYLSFFDLVVYGERGESGFGSLMSEATRSALETYVQNGGHLLVTGFDTLGDPSDSNLAQLVRAINPGDLNSGSVEWQVSRINHPILNGPNGDFRGMDITATGYNDDALTPDTSQGAVELISSGPDGSNGKLIFTELANPAGSVGYWNGGLSGTTTDAQPDFNDGGNAQSIFLNYVAFALGSTTVTSEEIEVALEGGAPVVNGASNSISHVALGQSSASVVTIRNVGLSPLTNLSTFLLGTDAADYSLETLPNSSLLPGEEFNLELTFSPSASGSRSVEIRILSSDILNSNFRLFISAEGLINSDGDSASDSWENENGFNPAVSGDIETLDSDGDGDLDILEIFQGTDRNGAAEGHGLQNVSAHSESQELSTTFRRSTIQEAVEAVGQWSCDLANWYTTGQSDGNITVTLTETVNGGGTDYELVDVEARITEGNSDCLFYRLFLTPNE